MQEGPKKVLIVDDEEILTWIMSKTLSKDRKRYEVLVANDCNKALEIMESVPVDLVITDIRMPGMSGLDLLEEIRAKHPDTKVIVMTAYGNPEVQKEANERGCLHYLEKPFKIEDLRNLILDAIKVSKKGFVGRVADLQLTDIIQLNCLGRMKTALSVSKDDMEGVIYFQDGEIVHAGCGSRVGEDALFAILGWEGGDFTTLSGAEAPRRTIQRPWQELLIEAMRRKDEGDHEAQERKEAINLVDTDGRGLKRDETEYEEDEREDAFDAPEIDYETGQPVISADRTESTEPVKKDKGPSHRPVSVAESIPTEVIPEPSAPRPRSTKEKAATIQRLLVDWQRESEEIQAAAVVAPEGLILGAHVTQGRIRGEQLGALTASVFKVGMKAAKVMARGGLEEMYLRGTQGTMHLYVIDSKAILCVLARPDANIGVVHIESREICRKMAQILGL
jgi:CheY-like chemotaxis protein/predicted regulator of Ras-like GTPase activity (Roadblock/LC7/MglB family)